MRLWPQTRFLLGQGGTGVAYFGGLIQHRFQNAKGFSCTLGWGDRHETMWMRLWGGQTLTACAGIAEPGVQATPGAGGLLCPGGRKGLSVEPGEWRVLRTTGGSISSPRPNCWAPGRKWSLSRVAGAWIVLPTLGSSPSLSFGPERGPLPPAPCSLGYVYPDPGHVPLLRASHRHPRLLASGCFSRNGGGEAPSRAALLYAEARPRPRVAAGGSLPPASSSVLPHLDSSPSPLPVGLPSQQPTCPGSLSATSCWCLSFPLPCIPWPRAPVQLLQGGLEPPTAHPQAGALTVGGVMMGWGQGQILGPLGVPYLFCTGCRGSPGLLPPPPPCPPPSLHHCVHPWLPGRGRAWAGAALTAGLPAAGRRTRPRRARCGSSGPVSCGCRT